MARNSPYARLLRQRPRSKSAERTTRQKAAHQCCEVRHKKMEKWVSRRRRNPQSRPQAP